jgi:hypothetical protein
METTGKARRSLAEALRMGFFLLIFLLFPYPLALLLVLGVPLGWTYLLVYAAWAAFGVSLVYLYYHREPKEASRWSHRRGAYLFFAGLFVWYALTNTVLHVSVALNWFVFIALVVASYLEAMLDWPRRSRPVDVAPGTRGR